MVAPGQTPVLLIHGMWSCGETLKDLRRAFESEGYEVHAPDLPYHIPLNSHTSETKRCLAQTSIADYLEFLKSYAEQFSAPPIIVGHSMGALLAQLLAQEIPASRLIAISSAAPAGINGWSWSVIRTFGHNLFKFPLWKKTTEIGISNIRYGIANSQDIKVQEDVASEVTLESGRASTEIGMWFLFRKPVTELDTSRISCPVLIISGNADKITPASIQKKLAGRYGNKATLKLLDSVCHWTIGGSYFPKVQAHIFNWLNEQRISEQQAA